MFIALAYVGIIILAAISHFRAQSTINFNTFIESIDYVINVRGPFSAFLYEFGSSLYTPIATYDYVQMTGKYGHGITFLLSPINVVPNIMGITSEIRPKINYAQIILRYGLRGKFTQIGGSYTGEIIYNFQYLFPVAGFVLGMFVSFIDKKVENATSNNDFVKASFYILGFTGLVFYVRGIFFELLKRWVWSILMIIVLRNVYNKHKI